MIDWTFLQQGCTFNKVWLKVCHAQQQQNKTSDAIITSEQKKTLQYSDILRCIPCIVWHCPARSRNRRPDLVVGGEIPAAENRALACMPYFNSFTEHCAWKVQQRFHWLNYIRKLDDLLPYIFRLEHAGNWSSRTFYGWCFLISSTTILQGSSL